MPLVFFDNGDLFLTKTEIDNVTLTPGIADTGWHHVAVTKSNNVVLFYIDGVAHSVPAYNSTFTFGTSAAIGARGDNSGNGFYGSIDELAIYNRALTGTEIQAIYNASLLGKCNVAVSPTIVTHPQNTNAIAGTNVTLAVVAGGSASLSYQWRFNGTNIASATNSALTLTNVQFSQTGNYSVQVSNTAGSIVSSNAALTVVFPTPVIRALNINAMAGAPVTVPVTIAANGNENTLGFSLNFNTQRLAFATATWGASVSGATLLLNTSQVALGRLGFGVAFPPGTACSAGTQEVVRVNFNSLPLLGTGASQRHEQFRRPTDIARTL
jgi:hypothetical protein